MAVVLLYVPLFIVPSLTLPYENNCTAPRRWSPRSKSWQSSLSPIQVLLRNLEARWDYSICVQWQLFFPGKYSDLYFCVYFLTGLSAWAFAASSMVIGIYGGGPAVEIWATLAIGAALSVF
jgi:hypothetical protein